MIRGMRIVNVVLAILLAIIGAMTVIHTLENQATDIAYRLGQVMGNLVVLAPLLALFYITWRGLSSHSTVGVVKKARIANIIAAVLVRHHPQSGWLDGWDRLKGGRG